MLTVFPKRIFGTDCKKIKLLILKTGFLRPQQNDVFNNKTIFYLEQAAKLFNNNIQFEKK